MIYNKYYNRIFTTMSAVKTKTLIVDILSNDNKDALGGLNLEKNIIDCKKLNKTIKTKTKDIEKKSKNGEDVTVVQQDVNKLEQDLSNLYSDRLTLLIGVKDFNTKIITERFKQYNSKIDEYKQKLIEHGENDYNVYKKQETDKIAKSGGKERNIMSKDDYFAKFIGNHEKANIERKLTYDLFKLYEKFKGDNKSTGIRKDIIEKETLLKNHQIKQKIKQVNTRQMNVFSDRIRDVTQMYLNDIRLLSSNNNNATSTDTTSNTNTGGKLQTFATFMKSKELRSSKTDLYKNMVRFSNYYNLIIDKSKDEKHVEVDLLDVPDGKDVKNFVEKNQTLKFILEKNSINTYLNKEFKDISIDNKTKNFLTYLIVVHFYNDILPLLNLSKQHVIAYKKKETVKDDKGNVTSTKYVESEKNVGVVLNRLNANVIGNMWDSSLTWP